MSATAASESQRGRFLTAQWRWVLMLHHELPPAALQPLVPPGMELDSWHGRHVVGLVAFRFLDTRVLGVAVPCHRDFDELNLRFYVKREFEGGWRRGVVFIRELVPRWAVATIARLTYGEPYSYCGMSSDVIAPETRADAVGAVHYAFDGRVEGSGSLSASFAGAPFLPEPRSLEEFVSEHYFGHRGRNDGSTLEYEVEHPPWRAWRATTHAAEGEWEKLYGNALGEALRTPAVSALVAEGSAITVRRPRILRA